MTFSKAVTLVVCLAAGVAAQEAPDPLTLRQALEIAGQANPQVQAARLRILEAEASALVSRSALGPQLTVQAGGTYQTTNLEGIGLTFPGVPRRVGPYRVFDARPVLTAPVIDFALWSAYRASRARTKVSQADAETVAEQTRLAIIDLYLQTLQTESRMKASEARLATADGVLRQVQDAEQAGTASKLDVARARQQREQEQTVLTFAKRDRDALVTLLLKTIGVSPDKPVAVAAVAPSQAVAGEPASLSREALAKRAEVRSLASKAEALRLEEQRAVRERWPKLSFTGDYGVLGQGPEQSLSTYSVGAKLTIPIWTSGRIENEVKGARIRIQQWEQEKRDQELAIRQEVTRALIEQKAATEAQGSAGRSAAAARETLELARLRYSAGMTTNLDVVTAQGNLAQAEEEEIRARYDAWLAQAKLARARGDVMAFLESR